MTHDTSLNQVVNEALDLYLSRETEDRATGRGRTRRAAIAPVLAKQRQQQHDAGMAKSITIRNVPDDVRDELAARAARSGRSLQEYLRAELIEVAHRQDIDLVIARARDRVERTQSELPRDEILEHLAEDRR